jgi:hypothetical protein
MYNFSIGPIPNKQTYDAVYALLVQKHYKPILVNVRENKTPTYIFVARLCFIPNYTKQYKIIPPYKILSNMIPLRAKQMSYEECNSTIDT